MISAFIDFVEEHQIRFEKKGMQRPEERPPNEDKTEEFADLLTGIMEDQQPLDGIPDDDH